MSSLEDLRIVDNFYQTSRTISERGATDMPWNLPGILLAVCAVLCAVGFYKFVCFLSIGYGFAVAGA